MSDYTFPKEPTYCVMGGPGTVTNLSMVSESDHTIHVPVDGDDPETECHAIPSGTKKLAFQRRMNGDWYAEINERFAGVAPTVEAAFLAARAKSGFRAEQPS